MLDYGWEFFLFNPLEPIIEQKTQDKYIEMYNTAFKKFINQICIPDPTELIEDNCDFTYYINFDGENDLIKLDENYNYNFLRSIFLNRKFRLIKQQSKLYYKNYGIDILNFYIKGKGLYIILKKSKS